ncbi:MAG: hypothetical protein PHH77_03695 [Victivallaceae bacterium]|nr:hypothetical protein [Victivallaceae bacterium]
MMVKRIIKISLIVLAAVLLIIGGTAIGIYYYGVRQNRSIEAVGKVELTPPDAKLGQLVTAAVLLKCPWHRKPAEAAALTGQGAALLDLPEISRRNIGWGYNIWKVSVEFKAYRTGSIPAGKIDVTYNRYDDRTTDLNGTFIIPPFKCTPLPLVKGQNPALAGAIAPAAGPSNKRLHIILAIAALALIAGVIILLLRRRRAKAVILPLWAVALNDLHLLRSNIRSGSVSLSAGFIVLTDIVRGYLEKRFRLPASKQTTEEFLLQMNRDGSSLPPVQRPFLQEFMQAAELVKFAKFPPDENLLSQAIGKAETLVNETRPMENEAGEPEGGES